MFDISWSEFLLIGIVALIVIGPKELPTVMRTLGQWTRKVRAMAADFQNQFQEAMREAEMADLKNEVDDLAHKVRSADPIKNVRDDFEIMGSDFERSLDSSPQQASPAGETGPALTTGSAVPQPDPAETAKVETAKTDTAKTDTAKTDTAKTDTAKTDTAKTDNAKADTAKTDNAKADTVMPVAAAAPATADVAPAAADEASSPPPPIEGDETSGAPEAAAEAAEPVDNAAPGNATRRTG
jgi:sec-independent protein translocase protein TatB